MTTRRAFLSLLALPAATAAARDDALREAIREAVGDAVAEDGGILLHAPAIAENGAQVPVTILVDSPMTADDHVTAIHVFATRNATPGIATFRLTPRLARAEVRTRIRLAEKQFILVMAQTNDGRVRRGAVEIDVTTGGCVS